MANSSELILNKFYVIYERCSEQHMQGPFNNVIDGCKFLLKLIKLNPFILPKATLLFCQEKDNELILGLFRDDEGVPISANHFFWGDNVVVDDKILWRYKEKKRKCLKS